MKYIYQKTNLINALNEDKVLIEIIEEKSENKKAEGRIVEILGQAERYNSWNFSKK